MKPLGGILEPLGRILVPLGPFWRHLGGVLGPQNPPVALVPLVPGRGGGDAGATPRKDSGRIRILGKGNIRK